MAYGMMNNYGAGYMNPYYASVSQPLQRPVMQDQPAPSPFQDVRFVNEKQAEAFITLAGQRVLLIDIENRKMWIKYADGMGITTTETYRFEKVEGAEKPVEAQPAIDLSNYVVKDDRHPYGVYLVRIDGHLTCVIDDGVYDIWDCRDELATNAWIVD